ncbi:hypothetical protein GDO78_009387 [Eleutherodactylus coqui]|uniref:Uncharacterized protein n=1 Tax=Eleutherodactylus coqui TaxID=57060 RepID=A0A8J6K9D5_ELECQ|nr:hypothetical protein GDO78_009387 [Eleutherodactylus coqui]
MVPGVSSLVPRLTPWHLNTIVPWLENIIQLSISKKEGWGSMAKFWIYHRPVMKQCQRLPKTPEHGYRLIKKLLNHNQQGKIGATVFILDCLILK